MSQSKPTVLVPIDVSSDEPPDPDLLTFLSPTQVVLLGWYPVPDQTGTSHMQHERGDEAVAFIDSIAAALPKEMDVATTVVFTRDREKTVDRIAEEYDCDVVLVPEDVDRIERIFVPIRSDVNLKAILPIVSTLLETEGTSCTLYHVAPEDEEDPGAGEVLLTGAADELEALGVDPERITTTLEISNDPVAQIIDAAQNHDVVIVGETEPSLVEKILGTVPTTIIDESNRPVLVVRNIE
jgi:nucleotide-binding universal stress UspA family protein